jgi:YfiH family protein
MVSAATGRPLPVIDSIFQVHALHRYPELLHGISTRFAPDGGYWNLSARRGTPEHPPGPEQALANREKLAARLGISLHRMVGCQQVHGVEVAVVGAEEGGCGMFPGVSSKMGADAMITATPGVYMLALSADCPPVFFYDPVKRAVGLAHSGWKGTVARISGNVVTSLAREFGSLPSDIVAVIGPGIGPCCYEVGENVVEAAEASFPTAWQDKILEARGGSVYFSLWAAIRQALLDAGVPAENISSEDVCTSHNLHTFYSHRGEAGQCGLFGAVLGLREP